MALEGRRALFISYNGMLDPLGQSQVIPYLKELSKVGVEFTILSFERRGAYSPEGMERCATLQTELAAHNIDWHWLPYHKTPSLPATVYDVIAGTRYASSLVRQKRIEIAHARAHIPVTIALALKRRFGIKMIFDVRGLMAEEYVDADHWQPKSVPVLITKAIERRAMAASDAVVTLTDAIWKVIKDWDGLRDRALVHQVIPCCADLELFKVDKMARARLRRELKVEDKFVLVYSGSIDGWYLTEEMADFFVSLLRAEPEAHFLWLTSSADRIDELMRQRMIDSSRYTVRSVLTKEVPAYLSASDAGLAFIKPCFSKLASSPTKTAEYLGCGLPLILNAGIGDSDMLITNEAAGALVRSFVPNEYEHAAKTIVGMRANAEETRAHMRKIAERLFDVRTIGLQRYKALYEKVLQ